MEFFVDAQAMHLRFPETFEVPTADELARLVPSMLVKLGALQNTERMWHRVLAVDGDRMLVRLLNTPAVITGVKWGDILACERRHVLDIAHGTGHEDWRGDFANTFAGLSAAQDKGAAAFFRGRSLN